MAELREVFNLVDADKNGQLSADEIMALLDMLGTPATAEQVDDLIRSCDADGDGTIDLNEFVVAMSTKVQVQYTPQEVKAAFRTFASAATPTGFIRSSDLLEALQTYASVPFDKKKMAEMVSQLEMENSMGLIRYTDLVDTFML